MASDLILLTGGTGHIGFRVLVLALQAGFRVRAAVRSEAKASQVKSNPVIKSLSPGDNLTFVIIPDLTADGAYNEAVQGVKHIIHVASPIPDFRTVKPNVLQDEAEKDFIHPAVKGTIGMLESAKNYGSNVQRIVVTSSIAALAPNKYFRTEEPKGLHFTAESRTEFEPAPYATTMNAYAASKVAALLEAETWVQREKPSFDVVHVFPGYVIGRDDFVTDAQDALRGTNLAVLSLAFGTKSTEARGGTCVHVDDVAKVHLLALNPKIPGNQNFIANTSAVWEDAIEVFKEDFPDEVKKGIFKTDAVQPTMHADFDGTKTEETFGFKFLDYKEMVRSTVKHYLELSA